MESFFFFSLLIQNIVLRQIQELLVTGTQKELWVMTNDL